MRKTTHAALATAALLLGQQALADGAKVPPWPTGPTAPKDAPNVVLVLLDDVGFGAAGTFGGPTETPALDKLAAQGLRYNQFHTTALCSPTRAALLSGRNHHRASFGTVTEIGNSNPGYNAFWKKSVATLPEILKRNGYNTAAFGKWHNTPSYEQGPAGPFDRWPTGLGFEYFYGFLHGEVSQWEPPLHRNTTAVEPARSPAEGYHVTTDLVDDAIRWVRTHDAAAPQKPYFLYFATGATHAPHHVPEAWVARFKGRFDQGWDVLREEIFARQKRLGVIPASAELTPRPAALPAWASLSADQQRLYARQAEVYAGFLAHTDAEIGRLLDTVRAGPKGDNTLVLYIVGDNGASAEGGLDGSDDNGAAFFAGLGTDVERQLPNLGRLGGPELDNHFAAAWAWGLDAPFQWTKQVASHFGGTRNPLVVSWPARIKDAGAVRGQFSHVNDIAPTLYELLGITFPGEVDGVKQEPIDGSSLAASFTDGKAPSRHRVQYFEQLGNRAIYKDGWVAAAFHALPWALARGTDFESERWELYDVTKDFSEAHDLADKYPEKLKELKALFDVEARKNNVYPLSNGLGEALLTGGGRPSLTGGRKELTFPGDTPRLPVSAAPQLYGPHRITARVQIPAKGATGVVAAVGGRYGGWALYVRDGRLVYEHNFFGRQRSVITAIEPLPGGAVEVGFELQRSDAKRWGGGTGTLTVNGRQVGQGTIAHIGGPSFIDSFDIGADRSSPVSDTYQVPNAFTGKVEWVRFNLGGGPPATAAR
jgi:arylsulfatase